jgi:transcriptional regulator, AsnC family
MCGVVTHNEMVSAYIMIKTAAGKSEALLEATRSLAGVSEAHIVAGTYDIIAEASGDEVYDVMHSVASGIRDLDGVSDTRTYMCLE